MKFYSYWKKWIEVKYVEARGFEPPTSASRTQRSTKLSYVPTHGELFLEAKPAHLGEQVISKTNRTRVRCRFSDAYEVGLVEHNLAVREDLVEH